MEKKKDKEIIDSKITTYPLEFLVGDRFGKYAKYIIQDRALPDIRDGLKPVQRRILYAMYLDRNDSNHPYRKSAKTVGAVIANFHPHGDTSVYDAMVRLSQTWKVNYPLIDMQGNNGSIDDDPAAAMRYTEARLSELSSLLLLDIEKNTVINALNFDDSTEEPTVLPAHFPNLLVNGSKGISAGYATEIPPHNLEEVIKATSYRLLNPNCEIEEIIDIIKGPDFPTGGIVQGRSGIIDAYKTGKGKCVIRSKIEVIKSKSFTSLIITEIPYEVVKSKLVIEIDNIRFNKKIDGIIDVRDESDREGLKIVIEIKNEVNVDVVLNYLYKSTSLQVSYNFNMVAIINKRPVQVGILDILDGYIAHLIDVTTRRSEFELAKANARLHIIKGLIKAISVLDEIIKIIRQSHDKSSSKLNLENRFGFSEKQSEAIVSMQLYRLSSTDITELQKEEVELEKRIVELTSLLESKRKMTTLVNKELLKCNEPFYLSRRSLIQNEVESIEIDKIALIAKEDVMIAVTRDGYVKRSTMKSYSQSAENGLPGHKNGDILIGFSKANTLDVLLIFLESGNFLYVPVHEIEESKWKDEGKHINNLVSVSGDEKIVSALIVKEFKEGINIIIASQKGFIKKSKLSDFVVQRYSKPTMCIRLLNEDKVVGVGYSDGDSEVIIATTEGFANKYSENDISLTGIKSSGVKSISNIERYGDVTGIIINSHIDNKEIFVFTREGGIKIISSLQLTLNQRLSASTTIYKYFKNNPQRMLGICYPNESRNIMLLSNSLVEREINLNDQKSLPFDRIIKETIDLNKGEELIALSNLMIPTISSETAVYTSVQKIKEKIEIEEIEEEDGEVKNLTIFDFVNDI